MRKITFKKKLFTTLCSLFVGLAFCSAQEMMYEIPLSNQISNSNQIVEGKVISKNSFWDLNHQNIYTVNIVEVYKVFKGQALTTLQIITEGGVVDMTAQITTLSLELAVGDIGVFMLHDSNVRFYDDITFSNKFESYSAIQGFYKYDLQENRVSNPYLSIDGIGDNFYPKVTSQTQSDFIVMSSFDIDNHIRNHSFNRLGGLVITDFSPSSITGGTRSILTINGAGFGATMGNVLFRDANSGGSTYFTSLDSQIISWSDTQILVEVPSRAGTGTFRVVNSGGGFNNSGNPVVIPYSEINVTTSSDIAYPTQHVDDNGNGGYTWSMNVTFFLNNDANQSFTRAFDTWRCETGINWDLDPSFTTINTIALDNTNIIRFDNSTELPAGVLGRNTSYFSGCSGGTEWYISELDIVFDSGTNWQYGPGAPTSSQIDFETVAVHELGHGHQLAHVIDPNAIMHYAVGSGVSNRVLSTNDISGGNDVQDRSTTTPVCFRGLMTDHSCSLGINESELQNLVSIYPNPAKNELFIRNDYHVSIDKIEMYDITGRVVKVSRLENSNSLHSLNVSELSNGVYLVNIDIEGKVLTKKIVIE